MQFVRSQFPALTAEWALFDNAGGTQVPRHVVRRLNEYLYERNVQIGGSYPASRRAAEALEAGRAAMKTLTNAARSEEIVFAPSSTVALQNLARAMRHQFSAGDEVIVTVADHESNIGPWVALEEFGVVVKVWPLCKTSLQLELADLDAIVTERTKLVAVTHVSNILGSVNPIAEIAARVHEHGARICVDSVAYAPHRLLDVQQLDVDYLVFSLYKVFGPHYAVMYGRHDLLLELDGLYHYFYGKEQVPQKLEPGNASYELAYSAVGILDYLSELGGLETETKPMRERVAAAFSLIQEHEARLGEQLLSYLRDRSDCVIVGLAEGGDERRVPTISFKIAGTDSGDIASRMDRHNLAIRYGDFHARRLIEFLNLEAEGGVVRASMAHYNTAEEVNRLTEAFDAIL